MDTARLATLAAAALLAALAVLQLCVACGAPWGRLVWGGAHRVLPRRLRIGSALSILLYACFAALLLCRAGILPGGDHLAIVVLTWVLFAYFVVGIIMNAASRSPAERWTMAPLCAVLASATLVVALG